MDVDEEVDSKKIWISERKTCSSNCDTSMNVRICRRRCRVWSKKRCSRSFERLRKDGMISCRHQVMQKRSHKLQSLQARKKQCRQELGKWAGDSQRVRNEIEEKHAQVQELLGGSGVG